MAPESESQIHAGCAREIAQCYEEIREREARIDQLKSLVIRAINAFDYHHLDHLRDHLIAELIEAN